jgi:hypothetical protein
VVVTDSQIVETTLLSRADDVIATEIDGEAIVMTIAHGLCFGFDSIGTRIWSLLERPQKFGDICSALIDEYEVDGETCRKEVARLLGELARERLIVVDNEPGR